MRAYLHCQDTKCERRNKKPPTHSIKLLYSALSGFTAANLAVSRSSSPDPVIYSSAKRGVLYQKSVLLSKRVRALILLLSARATQRVTVCARVTNKTLRIVTIWTLCFHSPVDLQFSVPEYRSCPLRTYK